MNTLGYVGIALAAGAVVGVASGFLLTKSNSIVEAVPSASDNDNTWIQWHKDLASRFSLKDANAIFIAAMAKIKPSIDTMNFRAYMKSVGISFTGSFTDILIDDTSAVFSGIGSVIGGFFNIGKVTVYVLVGGIAIAIIAISISLVKHPEIATNAAKAMAV